MVAHPRDRRVGTLVTLLALSALCGAGAAHAAVTFKHIVIVLQENRTPDNLFGSNPTFEPGVDLATSGVNSKGKTIPLTAEKLDGCYDLEHSHDAFELSLKKGADKDKAQANKGCELPPNPQFTVF
jgi:phospholipase C